MTQFPSTEHAHLDESVRLELRRLTGIGPRQTWPEKLQGRCSRPSHCGELYQGAMANLASPTELKRQWDRNFPSLASILAERNVDDSVSANATRCLIDLPCPALRSTAEVTIEPNIGGAVTANIDAPKSIAAIQRLLELSDLQGKRARIELCTNIPQEKGLGSSSADISSVLAAGCRALRAATSDEAHSVLLTLCEGASNPAHLDYPCLFAHRMGYGIRRLARTWPAFHVLGFDPGGTVRTDDLPPLHYSDGDLRQHSVLIEAMTRAIADRDASTVAKLSTVIAKADPRLPHDHRQLAWYAKQFRAAGYAVSHSGVVAALLWPRTRQAARHLRQAGDELRAAGLPYWAWSL